MANEYIVFSNKTQPAINDTNMNRLQQLIKADIKGTVGGDTLPIGTIIAYGASVAPENWLICDGRAVNRTTYQNLFNIIGISYGAGDGFTTFNLPNLTGKNPDIAKSYIIKATQSSGIVATVVNNLESTSTTDALSANMGRQLVTRITTGQEFFANKYIDNKKVYGKRINFGNLPNNTTKRVSTGIDVSKCQIIEIKGTMKANNEIYYPIPWMSANTDLAVNSSVDSSGNLTVSTSYDASTTTAIFTIYYTKN